MSKIRTEVDDKVVVVTATYRNGKEVDGAILDKLRHRLLDPTDNLQTIEGMDNTISGLELEKITLTEKYEVVMKENSLLCEGLDKLTSKIKEREEVIEVYEKAQSKYSFECGLLLVITLAAIVVAAVETTVLVYGGLN